MLAGSSAAEESTAVRSYVDAVLPSVTDTVREPGLPGEIMPSQWPGPRLYAALERCSQTFAGTTGPYLQRLLP